MKKKGASYDLPIALSVLEAVGNIPAKALERVLVAGELSLDGKVQEVEGVLPIVLEAKAQGFHTCKRRASCAGNSNYRCRDIGTIVPGFK